MADRYVALLYPGADIDMVAAPGERLHAIGPSFRSRAEAAQQLDYELSDVEEQRLPVKAFIVRVGRDAVVQDVEEYRRAANRRRRRNPDAPPAARAFPPAPMRRRTPRHYEESSWRQPEQLPVEWNDARRLRGLRVEREQADRRAREAQRLLRDALEMTKAEQATDRRVTRRDDERLLDQYLDSAIRLGKERGVYVPLSAFESTMIDFQEDILADLRGRPGRRSNPSWILPAAYALTSAAGFALAMGDLAEIARARRLGETAQTTTSRYRR